MPSLAMGLSLRANLNTGQITSAERWMNAKTGAY